MLMDHQFSSEFLLENVSGCCVIHGKNGEIEYLNDSAASFFGMSKEALLSIGKKLEEVN